MPTYLFDGQSFELATPTAPTVIRTNYPVLIGNLVAVALSPLGGNDNCPASNTQCLVTYSYGKRPMVVTENKGTGIVAGDTLYVSTDGTIVQNTETSHGYGTALDPLGVGVTSTIDTLFDPSIGSSSGSTTLAALTDVQVSTPTNGQALRYNTGVGKWENENDPGGSYVDLTTDQAIGGNKTFSNPIIGSVTGTAANITNTLDQVPAPVANVDFNTHKGINVEDATASSDVPAFHQIADIVSAPKTIPVTYAGGKGDPLNNGLILQGEAVGIFHDGGPENTKAGVYATTLINVNYVPSATTLGVNSTAKWRDGDPFQITDGTNTETGTVTVIDPVTFGIAALTHSYNETSPSVVSMNDGRKFVGFANDEINTLSGPPIGLDPTTNGTLTDLGVQTTVTGVTVTPDTNLPAGPRQGCVSVTVGTKTYTIGGTDISSTVTGLVEVRDQGGYIISPYTALPTPVTKAAGCTDGTFVYVIGGDTNGGGASTNLVQKFDPAGAGGLGSWTTVGTLQTARNNMDAVFITSPAPALLVIGGCTGVNSGQLLSCETSTDYGATWGYVNPRTILSNANAVEVDGSGNVYSIGGYIGGGAWTDVVEKYVPGTNTWSIVAPLLSPRSTTAVATTAGFIFIFGGGTGSGLITDIDFYDPIANTWTHIGDLTHATQDGGCTVAGWNGGANILYISGNYAVGNASTPNTSDDIAVATGFVGNFAAGTYYFSGAELDGSNTYTTRDSGMVAGVSIVVVNDSSIQYDVSSQLPTINPSNTPHMLPSYSTDGGSTWNQMAIVDLTDGQGLVRVFTDSTAISTNALSNTNTFPGTAADQSGLLDVSGLYSTSALTLNGVDNSSGNTNGLKHVGPHTAFFGNTHN